MDDHLDGSGNRYGKEFWAQFDKMIREKQIRFPGKMETHSTGMGPNPFYDYSKATETLRCRCTPLGDKPLFDSKLIDKAIRRAKRISKREEARALRTLSSDAEIFRRASRGSWSAKQIIYDAQGSRPFARN